MENFTVITGSDDFLVAEAARRAVKEGGGGLEIVDSLLSANADAQLADVRAVLASVSTPPFLEPRKTTWWKNANFLAPGKADGEGGSRAVAAEVKDALERLAQTLAASPLPENQTLVISSNGLRDDSRFKKILAGKAKFVKFAAASPFAAEREAGERAIDAAKALGLVFAPGALRRFIATVGCDTRSIYSETGKLRDWLGEERKTIAPGDIDEVSSPGAGSEPPVWMLTDAFSARDVRAVAEAALHFCDDAGAVAAVSMVESHFRKLVAVKDAIARRRLAEAQEMLGLSPGRARNLAEASAKWSLGELRVARARLVALRERLVSGGDGPKTAAVAELVDICRPRGRVR